MFSRLLRLVICIIWRSTVAVVQYVSFAQSGSSADSQGSWCVDKLSLQKTSTNTKLPR